MSRAVPFLEVSWPCCTEYVCTAKAVLTVGDEKTAKKCKGNGAQAAKALHGQSEYLIWFFGQTLVSPLLAVAPDTAGLPFLVPSGLSYYPITHKQHLFVL